MCVHIFVVLLRQRASVLITMINFVELHLGVCGALGSGSRNIMTSVGMQQFRNGIPFHADDYLQPGGHRALLFFA